jgi:tRNA threonylcarbamoyladenosine biosynthesis protein TsaB
VLTLGITTSTPVMGVALARGGEVVAHRCEPAERRHAERLVPLVLDVLADAGRELGDVGRLAVDIGPGLFTGLRVGLATVGGLARGLDVGVVVAPSLVLLAAGAGVRGPLLAVIDARRGEVFAQPFLVGATAVTPAAEARVLDPAEAAGWAGGGPSVGDGAVRYRPVFAAAGVAVAAAHPSAAELARRADQWAPSPGRVPTPHYLRPPDARVGAWTTRAS